MHTYGCCGMIPTQRKSVYINNNDIYLKSNIQKKSIDFHFINRNRSNKAVHNKNMYTSYCRPIFEMPSCSQYTRDSTMQSTLVQEHL